MPVAINPIKKATVKKKLIEGQDAKSATLAAGYAPSSANNATALSSVKQCQAEIINEITSQVTVENVLKEINETRKLANKNKDFSTGLRATELKGKYLAMFTDKTEINSGDDRNVNKLRDDIISRLNNKN